MKTVTTVEAAALAALVLALQAGILLNSVARPLGSAIRGYEVIAHRQAERAAAMPGFGESIEVRGTRIGRGS